MFILNIILVITIYGLINAAVVKGLELAKDTPIPKRKHKQKQTFQTPRSRPWDSISDYRDIQRIARKK